MEIRDRKHTWVHFTYEKSGTIDIEFVTDRWKKGRYKGRCRRTIRIRREDWPRIARLIRLLSYSPHVRYTLFAWNGYSVSWEQRRKPSIDT